MGTSQLLWPCETTRQNRRDWLRSSNCSSDREAHYVPKSFARTGSRYADRIGQRGFVQKRKGLVLRYGVADQETVKQKFDRLVNEWHDATDMHSSVLKVISHPAYLQIIAMGNRAIPLILREMKAGPGHWLPAIEALTEDIREHDENPAKGCLKSSEARDAWVRWGESKRYL